MEFRALLVGGALCGAARNEAFELAAHLEQLELAPHVDLGDDHAAPRQDGDEALAGEALQRFADRRAADAQALRKLRFRDGGPGRQLERDDQLFQVGVGAIREAAVASRGVRFSAGGRDFSCS
jgi:hypothetical protein